jgi:mevalonate kinase
MSSFNVSVPSKTFLTGEYLSLLDGPAILLNTQPRFHNKFELNTEKEYYYNAIEDETNPLHHYWNENEDFLADFDSKFMDPFYGKGGFGASSAHWATFYAFVNQYHPSMSLFFDKTKNENDFTKNIDFTFVENFLKKYRSYSKSNFPPSGYDVISQWIGKVAYIDVQNKILKKFDWPFNGLSFVLIKSNEKIATHEHLKNLGKDQIPEKLLRECVAKNLKAFETKSQALLIEGIYDNFEILRDAKLVAPEALKTLDKLHNHEYVLAAKGCGALGADVFCVLIKTENLPQFVSYGASENMNLIADERSLSHGIEVTTDFEVTHTTLH